VTPASLHLSSERLQTPFVGPNAPAKPRPESWGNLMRSGAPASIKMMDHLIQFE
jgi:hypothetical protein